MYSFVKFVGRNSKIENRITITRSHSFGLPTKFYKDNSLDDYKTVELYWDGETRAVGLKFTNEIGGHDRFAITKHPGGFGGSVLAKSFFTTYGLSPDKYRGRYTWKKENIEGVGELFIIELKERQEAQSLVGERNGYEDN
jgi:hypothetical protein